MRNLINGMLLVSIWIVTSCSDEGSKMAVEAAKVLSQSAFYTGEQAAGLRGVTITGGETGTIGGPSASSGGSDTGVIPVPGSNSLPAGSTSPPAGGTTSPTGSVTTGNSSSSTTTPSPAPAPASTTGSTTSSPTSSPSAGSTPTSPPVVSNGAGTDGGSVNGNPAANGSDQGGIITPVGTANNGTSSNPGNEGGSSTMIPTPSPSGTTTTGNSPTPAPAPSPSNNPSNGTDAGGVIANNPSTGSSSGNDGGSVNQNPSSNGNDTGGIANNGGSTGGGTVSNPTSPPATGNNNGGTPSNTGNPPVVAGNGGGSGSPSSGTTGGTDGGSVNQNPPSNGNDTRGIANNGGGSTSGGTASNPTSTGNPPVIAGGGGANIPQNPTTPTWIEIIKKWFNWDGGNVSNQNPGTKVDIGRVNKEITASISRVCSQYRSQIPYPRFIFFEEARHPILSMEVTLPRQYRSCELRQANYPYSHYQGYAPFDKFYEKPTSLTLANGTMVVKAFDLSKVNMLETRWRDTIRFELDQLKAQFPRNWYKIAKEIVVTVHVCDDTDRDGRCTDEKPVRMLSINNPVFTLDHIPSSMVLEVWNGRHFTRLGDPEICEKQYSPLVLDLVGKGFELSAPGDGVYFDINNTGKAVATGWTKGKHLAFLVRDIDKSGEIENGSELFGNATRLRSGGLALNGFEALKDLDSNQDGKFDKKDNAWKEVRLWLDNNHNGISERGELVRLEKFDVESIDLNYVGVTEVDPYGNQTLQRSSYTRKIEANLVPLQIIDIWFNTLIAN